jgi:hypothetical protein
VLEELDRNDAIKRAMFEFIVHDIASDDGQVLEAL